jgi:hypothetical protein
MQSSEYLGFIADFTMPVGGVCVDCPDEKRSYKRDYRQPSPMKKEGK